MRVRMCTMMRGVSHRFWGPLKKKEGHASTGTCASGHAQALGYAQAAAKFDLICFACSVFSFFFACVFCLFVKTQWSIWFKQRDAIVIIFAIANIVDVEINFA